MLYRYTIQDFIKQYNYKDFVFYILYSARGVLNLDTAIACFIPAFSV